MADRNGYIGRAPGDSSVTISRQTYTVVGVSTDTFTFVSEYTPGLVDVYLNGAKLITVDDYTATDGSTISLTTAAVNGDVVEVVAYKAFNLGQVSSSASNFLVNGTLTVSGDSTFNGNVIGDSATNISGINSVTANTFFGNVSGIAATFTGDVTIGGVLTYEDVTNVDSIGIVTAQSGVQVLAGGVGIADSIYHLGDTNTQIRFPANDTVTVETSGSEAIRIDSNGYFGIGTNNPDKLLHVQASDASASSNSFDVAVLERNDDCYLKILSANNKVGGINFGDAQGSYMGALYYDHTPNALIFNVNEAERLRITSGGVLGVNTTTSFDPSATLSIYNGLSGADHTMVEIVADTNESSRIVFSEKGDTNKGSIRYLHGTGGDKLSFYAGNATESVSIASSVVYFRDGLVEECDDDYLATTLGTNGKVDLTRGNVARFSGNETGSTSVNFVNVHSTLEVGDTVSFTVSIKPNGAGYINAVFVDSVSIPASDTQLNWQGGSAPSSGSADGHDVYTFQVIKTGGNTDDYLVFASQPVNYT